MNAEDVNLYLVGFMGTGKTTVARSVARRIGFDCIDSDHEIERSAGKTISEIFASDGEAAFRRREREFVQNHPAARIVVACGGGLAIQPGIADVLRGRGVIVCLHASVDTILERTARHNNRPLIEAPDRLDRIRRLYAEREPIYRSLGTMVLTDARSLRDVAAHVVRIWSREAAEFAKGNG